MMRAATRFDLEGGTVALLEESHAIPLVSIVIALRCGSAHDPRGKEGLARIAMRMLRRGCEGMSSQQIEQALDNLGGEMAVDTSVSTIAIHAQVIGRNVEPFVELIARILSTPTFPEDEFERLKRETVAEIIEARDSDRVLAQKAFQRTFFADHPYGRNAGGTTGSVATLERQDAITFYTRHVLRSMIVIGFAGDLTPDRASLLAQRLVAKLPHGAPEPELVPPPAPVVGRRLVFVDKPERTQTQLLVAALGTWPHDPDHIPLTVANAVFGGTFTSRLMQEVRVKRGWSYGTYSRLSVDRQRHAFSMSAAPGAADAAACLALELELFEAFVKDGITAEEADFIKLYLTRSYAFDIDTANKRLHQSLDVELLGLPKDYYTGYIDHVKAVTTTQANDAIRARLSANDLVIVVVGTASELAAAVGAVIPRLAGTQIVPYDAE